MAQQNINIGVQDAKTGDSLFTAFTKTEANFTELYTDVGTNTDNIMLDGDNTSTGAHSKDWVETPVGSDATTVMLIADMDSSPPTLDAIIGIP